jgi:glycosyltransferase involved in cell wall biosynthesis
MAAAASNLQSLSIFFPCYNDAATIGTLVTAAHVVGQESQRAFEIIVVDDGSTDNSRDILKALSETHPELRTVFHAQNQGYGAALRSGFLSARNDLIFYTDGDGQYDVLELSRLLPVMQEGVDVVNGYKISRSDPFHRIILGKVYLKLMRLLFRFKVRDVDCDFRLIRKSAMEKISLRKLELAGYRFVDYPVHHYHRVHGRSQFFNFKRLFITSVNILRLFWELNVRRESPRNVAYPAIEKATTGVPRS